jgi:L-ascorbate metabolism protein UlaG (beta-lactamase superfamily)
MTDSLAAIVRGHGEPLVVEHVTLPALEPGSVLVRVDAATLCGTDVHFWHGMIIPPDSTPYIPGHETCGTIVDLRGPRTDLLGEPLGVGDRIIAWGVGAAKVLQLDWWQTTEVRGVKLVATPAQHFSGRGLNDGNKTLWASWVIQYQELNVFFSGDTGYFDGFKAIGDRYGPFDVAMLETGPYDAQWPDVHMQPEQTLQAFIDLKGKWLMPVHNGTFDLGLHAWREPFDRIAALAAQRGVQMTTPEMGAPLDLKQPQAGTQWWRTVE